MYEIKIRVNGEEIKLTEFPARIITDVILAMLKSLRGVEDVEDVVIEMKK